MAYSGAATNVHDLRVVFGCCEPHLLSLYLKMGQRTYAPHNINSPSAGYLIPLVSFVPDADALRGVGPATAPGELPACVETVLARGSSVRSEVLSAPGGLLERDPSHPRRARRAASLDVRRVHRRRGPTLHRAAARSSSARRVTGCSSAAAPRATSSSCLDGTLEVRDGDTIVNVLTAGDAFGEMAFLLERPRSFDVDAATDDTRVLSLSEGALRTMIAEDATIAAKLLLNLSRMLCVKLIRAS